MYNSYNEIFCEYIEYIINVLNMCITDIGKECFPWMHNSLEDKPRVPITQPVRFEKYYDSEDSLDKEYDLV